MHVPVPDPRLAVAAGVIATVASPRVRQTIGKGVGYTARGVMKAGSPLVHAGEDIYTSAREVASPHPTT